MAKGAVEEVSVKVLKEQFPSFFEK